MSKIDSHKLMYHPERVSDWLKGATTYPIYAEVSLTSACNHRCKFCAPRFYLDYKPIFMDTLTIKNAILDMATVGVKAIMFGGEGEPLLHKDFIEIAQYTKHCGIDISLTTNGVLFNKRKAEELIPILSWVKFSVDAGNDNTYAELHGTRIEDFKTVLDNISRAVFIKKLKKSDCDIGVQSLLFKHNIDEMWQLAQLLKYSKPNYFVVKPYSPHEKTIDITLESPTKNQVETFMEKMKEFSNDYEFTYRDIAFENIGKEKTYSKCYGKDFMAYIDTLGKVYSCINYIGDERYCYGSIYEERFHDIWRKKPDIIPDLNNCRSICRLDNVNRYLWELKHPKKDVNFI